MRYAFGLVSILISVALILLLFAGPLGTGGQSYLGGIAQQRKQAMSQANQWSGKAADGSEKATDSITFEITDRNGSPEAILVKTVRQGGTMHVRYGLMPGDQITQIGPLPVRGGGIISDESSARDFLADGFARNMPLTIRRADATLVLPVPDFVAPAFVPLPLTTQPAGAVDEPQEPPIQPGLLDTIRRVPSH